MQVIWCAECGEMYEAGGKCPDTDNHQKPPPEIERLRARLKKRGKPVRI